MLPPLTNLAVGMHSSAGGGKQVKRQKTTDEKNTELAAATAEVDRLVTAWISLFDQQDGFPNPSELRTKHSVQRLGSAALTLFKTLGDDVEVTEESANEFFREVCFVLIIGENNGVGRNSGLVLRMLENPSGLENKTKTLVQNIMKQITTHNKLDFAFDSTTVGTRINRDIVAPIATFIRDWSTKKDLELYSIALLPSGKDIFTALSGLRLDETPASKHFLETMKAQRTRVLGDGVFDAMTVKPAPLFDRSSDGGSSSSTAPPAPPAPPRWFLPPVPAGPAGPAVPVVPVPRRVFCDPSDPGVPVKWSSDEEDDW